MESIFLTTDGYSLSLYKHDDKLKWTDSDLTFDTTMSLGLPIDDCYDVLDGEITFYIPMALMVGETLFLVHAVFNCVYEAGGSPKYTPNWTIKYLNNDDREKIANQVDIDIMEESICLFGILERGLAGSVFEQDSDFPTVKYQMERPDKQLGFLNEYIGS